MKKIFFHWVTYNATKTLLDRGILIEHKVAMGTGQPISFITHRANRYPKRNINDMTKIIKEYSQDHITRSCGHRAEDLFCNALALRGFMPIQKKVKEFNNLKWDKTGHDLDFLFEKDDITYGCEIKNTLGYIEKEELEIKIEMCNFWEIKPLFIMRYSPKSYNKIIIQNGGYALIFETQIYELSQESLVKRIKETLGLPVICSKAIPEGMIDRFENWHKKHVI